MVKSILDNHLGTARDCCHCLSLKDGTILISVLGMVPGIYYLLFFAYAGELLTELLLHEWVVDALLHVQGVVGVILCAAQAMLLVAAITYQEVVILLYLWIVIAHVIVEVVVVLFLTIIVVSSKAVQGILWLILPSVVSVIVFVFIYMPVVNGFRRNIHTVVVIV